MAEVSNQRVIERYKELLALRTHDVIVRDAAIEALEAEVKKLQDANLRLSEETRALSDELRERDSDENPWEHPTRQEALPQVNLGD